MEPLEVFQAVQKWKSRPQAWKKLVWELVYVISGIRPAVFLDEVAFCSLESMKEFLTDLNRKCGVQIVMLTYTESPAETGLCGPPAVFVSDADFVKDLDRQKIHPLFVTPSPRVLEAAEDRHLRYRMGQILQAISQSAQDGSTHIDLTQFCSVDDLPSLAGCLLGYPVVYAPSFDTPHVSSVDCIVYRISLDVSVSPALPIAPDHLFSFSVPSEVHAHPLAQSALQSWKRRWTDSIRCVRSCSGCEIRTECRSLVLRF